MPASDPPNSEPLIIDDHDRYSQMRLIGWWDQSRIASARIMVVGAGALGNEVIKNLVLLGIGQIYLVDFDRVHDSNLTRSVLFREHHRGQPKAHVAALAGIEMNPDCQIQAIDGNILTDIGLGLVRDVDLVICCVDNREARLWINRMCWKTSTPWIDGGIQEINGVAKVFMPPEGSCYECAMTENDYRLISLRYSCPLLKQEDIQQGKVPTAPTIASIIGGLQVQEALKLLHQLPAAIGTALVFNGAANRFYQTRFVRRDDCLSHETYDPIDSLPLSAESTTARQLMESAAQRLSTATATTIPWQSLTLHLDRDYLNELVCRSCSRRQPVGQPMCRVSSREGICQQCQQPMQPESVCEISALDSLATRTLSELGIPRYDIVKLSHQDQETFFLLAGDAPAYQPTGPA